jgi:hypothetical protein
MLEDLAKPDRLYSCAVRNVLATLDAADQKILIAAVMDETWKMSTLESALANKGITLGQGAIKRHRFGSCSCSKI